MTFASTGPVFAQLEAFDKNGIPSQIDHREVNGILDTPVQLDATGIQSIKATVYSR